MAHNPSPIIHNFKNSSYDPGEIADSIARDHYCIIDDFISAAEVLQLRSVMEDHLENNKFKRAGIGNMHLFQVDRDIRGDKIKWIEKDNAHPSTLSFLEKIEALMQDLNRQLYLSLKDYECHFAIYPPGTFYEKHLDQFKSTSNRKISFAFYLNHEWKPEDGGELRIFGKDKYVDIEPIGSRMAIFRSDIVEHEVRTTNTERYSITGWLRDRPIDLPYI